MNAVALIPARGGSKRIPDKNIRQFCGKPLIGYTIEAALNSRVINRVVVSTDSERIAQIAKEYGAEVPFLRPSEIARDHTPDRDVILHAVDGIGDHPDFLVLLRPTTPLRTVEIIDSAMDLVNQHQDWTALRTVTAVKGVFHPYWMFTNEDGLIKPFIDGIKIDKYYQSQLLPPCYRLNGVVDILRPKLWKLNRDLFGERIGFFEIDAEAAVDIDDKLDFEWAEFLMKRLKNEMSDLP